MQYTTQTQWHIKGDEKIAGIVMADYKAKFIFVFDQTLGSVAWDRD